MCSTEHPVVSCCRVAAKEVGSGKHHGDHLMVETKVREMVTPQTLNKMFELDFTEQMDDKGQKVFEDSLAGNSTHRRSSL